MISNNAKHLHLIHRLTAVCNRLATLNTSDSYELMRQTASEQCSFLGCDYLVTGQASQGYADIQTCEESELLTDIAHGVNRFIHGSFKFDVKRKQDLKDVFLSYAEKLHQLARATVNELNRLDCGLSFQLGYVSSFTDEVIIVTKTNNGETFKISNMSYVYRDIKAGLDAVQLKEARNNCEFEQVITDEALKDITHKNVPFAFPLPNGELLGVGVNRGATNGKYLVLFKHLGREGSHLATRRAELKKDCCFANSAAEICKELRKFADMMKPDPEPTPDPDPLFNMDKLNKKLATTEIMKFLSNGQRYWETLDSNFYGQYLSIHIVTTERGFKANLFWRIQNVDEPHKKTTASAEKLETLIKAIIYEVKKWNADEVKAAFELNNK